MTIKKVSQTKIIFGNGDIRVSGGFLNSVGFVGFSSGEPVEIGTEFPNKPYKLVSQEDFPVLFEFHKTESIDAVIKQLENVKNRMNGEKQKSYELISKKVKNN